MARILITGATDGIGLATARRLAADGHDLVVHGRSPAKAAAAAAGLAVPGSTAVADFADLAAVRDMAMATADEGLDVLIDNAGTFAAERTLTADGHETTWQVNHLAPFLLTDLLLDALARRRGRVVFVAAGMYARAALDLADPEFAGRPYDGRAAYGQSKLANVLTMVELVRRLGPDAPVTVAALHPGVVATKLMVSAFAAPGQQTLDEAAAAVARLAVDPALAAATGVFSLGGRERPPTGAGADAAAARALYGLSCRQLGVPGLPG
jgi:NAD(P)-dependent dehydrogenase (short-subunit alcohol dehydrogenase family)